MTDAEILALGRSYTDGSAAAALGRQTCIIALGFCGPVAISRSIARGSTHNEIVAQARAWCVEKIHERTSSQSAASTRSSRVIVVDAPTDCDLTGVWDVIDERPMACGDTYLRLQQGNAYIGARRSRTRPAPSSGDQLYRCAGPSCPGLPYRASDRAHPASCAEPRTSP